MSKINIQGIIENIKSKTSVYTPLIEGIVNAIDSIQSSKEENGLITIKVHRENTLELDSSLPHIQSITITDNGWGFNQKNRDSFDTLYSSHKKKDFGGKGFGRFMYLKYFSSVSIKSNYLEDDGNYYFREFLFGHKDEIIVGETNIESYNSYNETILTLNNLVKKNPFDKELETIARKLVEKLLIFFINENVKCPKIVLSESNESNKIILNDYLSGDNDIKLVGSKPFEVEVGKEKYSFVVKVFKLYHSKSESKIILTGDNREVTETSLDLYVPEFTDEFYDEVIKGTSSITKNYTVKAYVLGDYLNGNVSLERDVFNFPKENSNDYYPISQTEIEAPAADVTKDFFTNDVKSRVEKKRNKIYEYVSTQAPWHSSYIKNIDLSNFPYNLNEERIELELQKFKFHQEQQTRKDVVQLLNDTEDETILERVDKIMSRVTETGKSDLAHYVCTRKVVLQIFEELRKRDDFGKANLEKDIHSIIYPMNRDSGNTSYEEHNLWLLDERLIFSQYIASDRKISKKKGASDEPDLVVFDIINSFRSGENELSNPLTIYEFKRPKRSVYTDSENPIIQIGRYLNLMRQGKYEMPEGLEKIKVNNNTPVYAYVVADLEPRIHEFAMQSSLTLSADEEGYFGYHTGYRMYIEIISFKKLMGDAILRNKIFFKKLHID